MIKKRWIHTAAQDGRSGKQRSGIRATQTLVAALLICGVIAGTAQEKPEGQVFQQNQNGMNSQMNDHTVPKTAANTLAAVVPIPPPIAPLPHGEGARRMGKRLRAIFDGTDWKSDPSKPFERIVYYQLLLERKLSIPDEVAVRLELGNEELRAGRNERAIETLETLLKHLEPVIDKIPRNIQAQIHQELALAYLREGERANCIQARNQPPCTFPAVGSGLHPKWKGAEGAVREYTRTLELNPDSKIVRWLLNVAYRALGGYPQAVPKKWLIPPERFKYEYDIGLFPEVAGAAGVYAIELSGGAIVEDFDRDGYLDIMVSSSGPLDHMHYFHNNRDGTFTDRTKEAGLEDEIGGLNIVLTDYNNDGKPDVLVLRGAWWGNFGAYPLSLLRNNGDGTFDDVTEEAGLMTIGPTQTAAWADYDGDGWLDLFVGHESKEGARYLCQLFHNNHDGTFTQVTSPGAAPNSHIGADMGFVKGVAWGDYNNDGRPDLYVSTMFGGNHLFRNDGPHDAKHPESGEWNFTDVTDQAGLGNVRYTFPTWFFDYDNDGWLDIFAGGYATHSEEDVGAFMSGLPHTAAVSRLFHNSHDGTFTEIPHAAGLDRAVTTMAANFGDLDNDGWLDVFLGLGDSSFESLLPKKMFRNDHGKYFQDVTTSGGFGNLQKGHGIAFADIENNGNEDVFEELGGAHPGDVYMPTLFHNPGHGNHWVTLMLEGVETNRAAYGARIKVTIDENGKTRSICRAVGSVSSFGGNPMRQHIGLGKATKIKEIEVWWPTSGLREHFTNVRMDRNYHLREGSGQLDVVHLKPYEIGGLRAH